MISSKEFRKIFTRQHGEFACGLACLSMIIKYHGGNARQEDLRNISGTSLQGTTLLGLYQAAQKLHFIPEAYEANMDSLKTIQSPVILHVIKDKRMEHYVVCFRFENGKFVVGDPGENSISFLSEQELEMIWQSKALLTLKPASDFIPQDFERKAKREWLQNLVREDYSILTVAFILGIIIAVLSLVTAVFSQKLIDDLLPSKNYEKILLGIGLFFILLIARSGLDFLRNIFILRQTQDMNNRLIDFFFSKILYLPKLFFDSTKTGEIISRMNDSRRIQQTLSYIVGNALIDVLALLLSIFYLLFYSWKMALITMACLPFFTLLVVLYNKKIMESQRNVMVSYAATEGLLIDHIQGINEIKAANKQSVFKQSIQTMYGIFQQAGYKLGIISTQYSLAIQIISAITSISLIIVGVFNVLNEQLTLGELMAIITIGSLIISSTANLSVINVRLQEAGVALDRFYEFLKAEQEFEPEEEVCGAKTQSARDENGICLQIKDLSFRFIGRKKLFEHMSKAMANDRAKHNILPVSKFGLMQITRQRVRPEMEVDTNETCPTCFGSGKTKPSILFTDSLEGKIDCLVNKHHVKKFTLHLHPYVAAYVNRGFIPLSLKWKFKYSLGLKVIPDQSLAFLEYKFIDPDKNELDMKEEKEIK